ncbi:matrix metalloproteinase-21-like [Glandiceps talaboti]
MLRTITNPSLILLCCACVALITRAVWAETVYHRRFLQDLLRDGGTGREAKIERMTENKAEEYLQNYGYMPKFDNKEHLWKFVDWEELREETQDRVSHRDDTNRPFKINFESDLVEFDEDLERGKNVGFTLPDEKILYEDGIKELQKRFNVPVTGELDERTVDLMYRPRCGVPDNEQVDLTETFTEKIRLLQTDGNETEEWDGDIKQTNGSTVESSAVNATTPAPTSQDGSMLSTLMDTTSDLAESTSLPTTPEDTIDRGKRYIDRFRTTRRKRSTVAFNGQTYKYRIREYHRLMDSYGQRDAIYTAFRMWDEVLPINFVESPANQGDYADVDIEILFQWAGSTSNCIHKYTGPTYELAHAWPLTAIHFNGYLYYSARTSLVTENYNRMYGPFDLLSVAVHEIGHVIGLKHNMTDPSNIMFASYQHPTTDSNIELSPHDRATAQQIYGKCSVQFDAAFDWVRWTTTVPRKRIFNTYFFKDDHYWMYENKENRARYGAPEYITRHWAGVPSNVDAIVHVWTGSYDDIYIFKGDKYWMYNSQNDRVYDYDAAGNEIGNGRDISEGFPARAGTNFPSIPSNIDTAYFDKRDKHIYFFKDRWVYAFDTVSWSCCKLNTARVRIKNVFIGLPNTIDVAYHSYYYRKVFFFKGDDYYEGTWNPSISLTPPYATMTSVVTYGGKINTQWQDVCEVGEIEMQ